LHVLGHIAKADACGRIFAVLLTQVSTVGLRLRHNMLAFSFMLEVSQDAVAAGEEQLANCTEERSKCCLICTVASWPLRRFAFGECGDMLEAMVRIVPPQPNGAMARVAPLNAAAQQQTFTFSWSQAKFFWCSYKNRNGPLLVSF
jgi:hypothetical protein